MKKRERIDLKRLTSQTIRLFYTNLNVLILLKTTLNLAT